MSRVRRIAAGAGHRYELDGAACDGVTTVIRDGLAKPNLIDWAARTVAGYAVERWDELAERGLMERYKVLEKAHRVERDAKAVRGTRIHDYAHRLAAGEELRVDDDVLGHVDAYLKFVDDHGVDDVLAEAVVWHERYRYAGTLDLLAVLGDSRMWLIDFKTGGSGVWPEVALQLAAYAHATHYIDDNGDDVEMPNVDACGAVWLRADGYDLFPIRADADVFRSFLYCQQVARFARDARERSNFIGNALMPERRTTA